MAEKKKKKTSVKRTWKRTVLYGLLLVFVIDFFFFESVVVTDTRMENSLFPGDVVVVNELPYGKRLPVTLLTLPFFRDNLPFTSLPSYIDLIRLPYMRLPGTSEVKRNDLMAFNYPLEFDLPTDKKTVVVKRCVALPGDTLAISDKKVFVNGELVAAVTFSKYRFRIVSHEPLTEEYLSNAGIYEGGMVLPPNVYDFYITQEQADTLRADTLIRSVNIMKIPRNLDATLFFPNNSFYAWNLDYFGDLIIPKAGMTVALDEKTLPLYKLIIDYYEDNDVYLQDGKVYINDAEVKEYTFRDNYYFVMDDNRDNSKDSRIWGFVPESHLLGRVSFVLFSADSGNRSWWSRLFKNCE